MTAQIVPGALVRAFSTCRVAHVVQSIGSGGGWWYALCPRSGKVRGSARVVEPGDMLVCADCRRRGAKTFGVEVTIRSSRAEVEPLLAAVRAATGGAA